MVIILRPILPPSYAFAILVAAIVLLPFFGVVFLGSALDFCIAT